VIPSLPINSERVSLDSAVNPFQRINSAGLAVVSSLPGKVSRFVVLRSMIGSNIPLAPAVTPLRHHPKQCFKPSIIQNRHRSAQLSQATSLGRYRRRGWRWKQSAHPLLELQVAASNTGISTISPPQQTQPSCYQLFLVMRSRHPQLLCDLAQT